MNHLEQVRKTYSTIQLLFEKAKERIKADFDSKFARDILPFEFENENDAKRKTLQLYQKIEQSLKEALFLELFFCFEKELFDKLKLGYDNAIQVMDTNYKADWPFSSNKSNLIANVKGFNGVGDLKKNLFTNLSQTKSNYLKQMIRYRDYLVHGKRFLNEDAAEFEQNYDVDSVISFMASFLTDA